MINKVLEDIEKVGIIPVVVIDDPKKVIPLAESFLKNGLNLLEITMRTKQAINAINILRDKIPEMLIGAGTVFSLSIAIKTISAGASFVVSPHFNPKILEHCLNNNIMYIPGAFTPSEIHTITSMARTITCCLFIGTPRA